jgi:tetratricopeptide (TPR) repeat protein
MSNKIFVLILISLPLISGCATTPNAAKPQKVAADDVAIKKSVGQLSVRTAKQPNSLSCPTNDKSWRKENYKQLVTYANACAQLRQWGRVEALGDWMAQVEPIQPWGAFYLSMAAEARAEWPRSIWMIELALKKSSREPILHFQKARILWSAGEYAKSVATYQDVLKLSPQFTDAHLFLGQLYYRDQDFKKAEKHFSAVLQTETENVDAVVGLGETYLALNRLPDAIAMYEKAVGLAPSQISYRLKLANLYENSTKDYAQALSAYKRIQSLAAERRVSSEELPIDVKEKIKSLELRVGEASVKKQVKK